jgi:hypothetical protein
MFSPKAHDELMAEKFHELDKAKQRVASSDAQLYRMAGARTEYRTMRASSAYWDKTVRRADGTINRFEVTEQIREDLLSEMDPNERNLSAGRTVAEAQEELASRQGEVDRVREEIDELEQGYTGWSRFFLVTSSNGHIHSSMHCSSCRITTRFGWLPQLSGKGEAEAVKECGPTLCTVCFPEAPTEYTIGKKLTKAQAEKMVA